MSRKLTAAAVALALAGGVYLGSGTTAHASNMGFKLEKDFAFVSGFRNFYYVSFPLFNGLGDIAGMGTNRCTATPDGIVDASDAVCDMFTGRTTCTTCSFAITKLDTTTCNLVTVKADKSPILGLTFQGTAWNLTVDPNRDIGYLINVANGPTSPIPTNRAVIVGSHDPSWTGKVVSGATCKRDYISVPYHVMYQHAAEIMCGLENTDWVDANSDGKPDTCPNGIFDNAATTGARCTLSTFDNEVGNNEFPGTDNNLITYQVDKVLGTLVIQGNNFSCKPGEAYLFTMGAGYTPQTFLPPHF